MSISVNHSLLHSFSSFNIAEESVSKRSFANFSLKTPKTPKFNKSAILARTPKTPMGNDRFIPNRSALNQDISHYLVTQGDLTSKENEVFLDDANANRRDVNCQRILPFGEKNTSIAQDAYSSFNKSCKRIRSLPSNPEKVLDAPNVKNDFYLQLMDWNRNNLLALALTDDLYIWNAATNEATELLKLPEGQFVSSVSWVDGSNNNLAVGLSTGEVHLYDTTKCQRLRKLDGHTSKVGSLSWNSYILSSGCKNGIIVNHDVRVQKHNVGQFKGHNQDVCGLKWSFSGQYLASGGNDNTVNIWAKDPTSEKPVHTFKSHNAAIKAIAWSPWKTNLLATGGGSTDKQIKIWNVNNGDNLNTVTTEAQVSSLLWSKEHYQEILSAHGHPKNEVVVWKYPELTPAGVMGGYNDRILGMCLSPDSKTVVTISAEESLKFWNCFPLNPEKKKELKANSFSAKIR